MYPVFLGVERPASFKRSHILIRFGMLLVILGIAATLWLVDLTFLSYTFGFIWLLGLTYLFTPLIVAVMILRKGSQRFLAEDGPRIAGWLRGSLAFNAYLSVLSDSISTKEPSGLRFDVDFGGRPTLASALLRLLFSIPSLLSLAVLSVASIFVLGVIAIFVILREDYPRNLYDFQLALLRWQARLLSYHASLVDRYPPFSLDGGKLFPEQP